MDKLTVILTFAASLLALGFAIMLYDKYMAKNNLWRVPEATLMGIAAIGGSVGCLLGMYTARHKTRKAKVIVGIPLLFILQAMIVAILFIRRY